MVFTNNISPVLFEIGWFELRWYGILFVVGLVGAYLVVLHFWKKNNYPVKDLDSLVLYLFVGLVVGARLGHVFFYNAAYFLNNPVEILKIWEGGLSSHGGAIGVFLMYWLWTKIHRVSFFKYPDVIVLGIPLLAGFVRLGNFFNSEILGTRAENFGVIFTRLGENFPRHPVQLYSMLIDWTIFIALILVYKKYSTKAPRLFFMFLFILLLFSGRFIVEFWKDLQGPLESLPITMGQLLSVPWILIAAGYFIFFYKKV